MQIRQLQIEKQTLMNEVSELKSKVKYLTNEKTAFKDKLSLTETGFQKFRAGTLTSLADQINSTERLRKLELECQQLKSEIKRRDNIIKTTSNCPADVKFQDNDPDIVYVRNMLESNPRFVKYHRIPDVNISSEKASSSTLYNRGAKLFSLISELSGSDQPRDMAITLVSFLKNNPTIANEISKTNFNIISNKLSPSETADMLSHLGMNFSLFRNIKRYFVQRKEWNIFPSNEKVRLELKSREPNAQIISTSVKIKSKDNNLQDAPCIKARSLVEFIQDSWNRTVKSSNKLVEDKHFNSKIWLMISGDKGGDTTKLTCSFLNVAKPNSPKNVHVIGFFKGHDSAPNLRSSFGEYTAEFEKLKSLELLWPTDNSMRQLEIFLVGDCNFLSNFVGHQGVHATKPCAFCNINITDRSDSKKILLPNDNRTLQQNLCNAKKYYNSKKRPIDAINCDSITDFPLLPIALSHVVPPTMHLIHGIVVWLWDKMYRACFDHDISKLSGVKKSTKTSSEQTLKTLASLSLKAKSRYDLSLQNEREERKIYSTLDRKINGEAENDSYDDDFDEDDDIECDKVCASFSCIALEKVFKSSKLKWVQCDTCKKWFHYACQFLVTPSETKLTQKDWNCLQCEGKVKGANELLILSAERLKIAQNELKTASDEYFRAKENFETAEKIKKSRNVDAQTMTALLEASLDKLKVDRLAYHSGTFVGNHVKLMLKNPKELTSALGHFDKTLENTFCNIFEHLAKIERLMSKTDLLSDDEVSDLINNCKSFGIMFATHFSESSVTPKIHILVHHVPEFVARFRTIGKLSEQGVEATHARMNKVGRTYAVIRSDEIRMFYQFQRLHVSNVCETTEYFLPKKRKVVSEN